MMYNKLTIDDKLCKAMAEVQIKAEMIRLTKMTVEKTTSRI